MPTDGGDRPRSMLAERPTASHPASAMLNRNRKSPTDSRLITGGTLTIADYSFGHSRPYYGRTARLGVGACVSLNQYLSTEHGGRISSFGAGFHQTHDGPGNYTLKNNLIIHLNRDRSVQIDHIIT